MESIFAKFKNFVGTESVIDDYDDDYDEYETYEEESYDAEPLRAASRQNQRKKSQGVSNLVPMPSTSSSKLVVYKPQRFEDMQFVVDSLKSRKSVVVQFDGLSIALVQRMLDFAAGTVCALGCTSSMVSDTVCIIVPQNIELIDSRDSGGNR